MKQIRNSILALLIGCATPLLIWVGAGVALYEKRKETRIQKKALPKLACSINADCPGGYVCANGCCVLARA